MRKYARARRGAIALACLIASTSPSWSASVCLAPLNATTDEPIERLHPIGPGRWIVETKSGLYQFSERDGSLSHYDGTSLSPISQITPLSRDVSLILSSRHASGGGVFRAQNDTLKVQEVNGSESLRFSAVGRLQIGALIGTDRGLYRIDSSGAQFQEAAGTDTGRVFVLQQSDENSWLIGAGLGFFRYDVRNGRTERVAGADTGEVTALERLPDNGWLAGAEKGLFRVDATGRSLAAVAWKKPFRVAELQKLADGTWLVRGEQGLFIADPQGRRLDPLDEDNASSWRIQHSDDRGALLQNKRLTYVLPLGAKKVEFIAGEPLNEIRAAAAAQDGWIIATQRGLYRIDIPKRRTIPLTGPMLGRITFLNPLKSGAFLVGAESGLFRTDVGLQKWELVPGSRVARANLIAPLRDDGGFLIGGQDGLFRAEPNGQTVAIVPGANLTGVSALERLPAGNWLVQAQGAMATADQDGREASLVLGSAMTRAGSVFQPLGDGRVLVGTPRGLLTTASTGDAAISFQTGRTGASWLSGTAVSAVLSHPCSDFADEMNLTIRATRSGPAEVARLLPTQVVARSLGQATIAAAGATLPRGPWDLQLVSIVNGKETSIGKPGPIRLETSVQQWIWANVLWLLGSLAALQVLLAAILLGAARWHSASLRLLRSKAGKILLWPSLILPGSVRAQRWVLSTWFKREREKVSETPAPVSVSIHGPDGADLPVSELMDRLGTVRRIWLQGASGMGKSTAFFAWRKAFFAEPKTLSRAARKYGFVFVPVSASAIDTCILSSHPETVIVGLAAMALAESGVPLDRACLLTMIRRGRVALAFDSPGLDLQQTISAYVDANPAARVIVTSEFASRPAFEGWQFSRMVERTQVEQLLQLWLGAYSGAQLTTQLSRDDVLPQLATYYDVRLAADIVTDDPSTSIAADRISLYRAPFARAAVEGLEPQSRETLAALAWTMTVEGRTTISEVELAALGEKSGPLLTADRARVLRSTDGTSTFDHDQLRFFLAAEHLVKSNDRMSLLIAALENSRIWACIRHEQEELWRFLAAMLSSEDVTALWRFSLERPERAFLQCALHRRGLETNVFPIGLGTALGGRDEAETAARLRSVEA